MISQQISFYFCGFCVKTSKHNRTKRISKCAFGNFILSLAGATGAPLLPFDGLKVLFLLLLTKMYRMADLVDRSDGENKCAYGERLRHKKSDEKATN